MRFQQPVDPAQVIGVEWANMTVPARILVRIASPRMAKAARYLSQNGVTYTNVPIMRTRDERPGPMTRAADRLFEGSNK